MKKTTPLYFGDFKEAITIFDREALFIEFSEQALDLWGKDLVGMKVRERLDVKAVDKKRLLLAKSRLFNSRGLFPLIRRGFMLLDLNLAKKWLRLEEEDTEEDDILGLLIDNAEIYVKSGG